MTAILKATVKAINFEDLGVTIEVSMGSEQPAFSISRKTADFTWLRSALSQAEQGCIVPPLTSAIEATNQSQPDDNLEIAQLQTAVQVFLDRILAHPKLAQSQPMINFLKPDQSYAPYYAGAKPKQAGFFKSLKSSMRVSTKEIDSWFDQSKSDIGSLGEFSDKCLKSAQRLYYARRSLAESCSDLAKKLSDFGDFESSQSRNIRSFAVSFEKTAASNAKHAQELNRTIIDGLRLIGIYCGTAEHALENRWNAMLDYEDACRTTQKRQHSVDKMKSMGQVRPDKADSASSELHQAELLEKQAKENFDKISSHLRTIEWPILVENIGRDVQSSLSLGVSAAQTIDKDLASEWSSSSMRFSSTAEYYGEAEEGAAETHSAHPRHDTADKIKAEVL